MRQSTRPIDMSCLTMLPSENIYESAAKLLFLSVKWARTIPSFLQVSCYLILKTPDLGLNPRCSYF